MVKKKNSLIMQIKKNIRIISEKCDTFKYIQLGISIKAASNLSFTELCLVLFPSYRIKKKTTRVSLIISSLVNETSNIRSSYSTLVQPLCINP